MSKLKYTFRIEFTTGDELYHLNAFYQINLSFSPQQLNLTWSTVYSGVTNNPWIITNNGRSLRYNVEDSLNCGGSNENIQTGTATTTIEVEQRPTIKTQNNRVIVVDGKPSCSCCLTEFGLLARGTSQDLNLECAMGPIISEYLVTPPYALSSNVFLDLTFNGTGELQDTGYENIAFYLDPVVEE